MSKKFIIFLSEYGVLLQGVLLIVLANKEAGLLPKVVFFSTATFLLLAAVGVTKVLKILIHKKRPPRKIEYFKPFDTYAFPSGHATGLSSVTFFMFQTSIVFGLLGLLVTLAIAFARVKSHVHDSVDMIAGVCVGVLVTYMLMPVVATILVPYILNSFF